jgi:RHS repeat-associated protein
MAQSSDPDGAIQYWYDNLGRTTKTVQTVEGLTPSVELRYAYDSAGNCTSLMAYLGGVYNSANVYNGDYDNLNRLRRVYQAGAGATVTPKVAYFTFDALDRLTVINRGEYDDQEGWNWVVLDSYAFDADSRMTGLTHLKGATTLASYTWSYDRASRPSGFTSSLDGTAGYGYDSGGQLTTADYDYQTDEAYSYDANGNRTNSGYDTDPNNRLASDGVYNYDYDSEGNRTKRTNISTGAVTEYTWDYRNRLTSVTERAGGVGTAATKVVEYKYDPDDRLVGKTLDPDGAGEEEATEEYYAYDQTPFWTRGDSEGSQMLFRFTGPNTADLADRYLWAPVVDLLLSDEKLTGPSTPGDIYWTLGDNLNTVRDIARYNPSTDTTTIVNHRVYDAFGKLTSETNGAVDLIFAFTGRLFDESTGLQNNLNRWYDPTVGRWLSEDPIGLAPDANPYRYVNNAPTYTTDPNGLWAPMPGLGATMNAALVPAMNVPSVPMRPSHPVPTRPASADYGPPVNPGMRIQGPGFLNRPSGRIVAFITADTADYDVLGLWFFTTSARDIWYNVTSWEQIGDTLEAQYDDHSLAGIILSGHGSGTGGAKTGGFKPHLDAEHLTFKPALMISKKLKPGAPFMILACGQAKYPGPMTDLSGRVGRPVLGNTGDTQCGHYGTGDWKMFLAPGVKPKPKGRPSRN